MDNGKIKVGGVPEHFSLPFKLCIEEGSVSNVEFTDQPLGTGQMIRALNDSTLDMAITLAEGTVMAIDGKSLNDVEILGVFVESSLQWGIHVNPKNPVSKVEELKQGCRIAISRQLSGSHLMAHVFARKYGWDESKLNFVEVGGLSGALKAFEEDQVDLFLWDRFMTTSIVELKRIGIIESPWPCFVVTCSTKILSSEGERNAILDMINKVLKRAHQFKDEKEHTIQMLTERYHLSVETATEWLEVTRYAKECKPLPEETKAKILSYFPPTKK